MNKFVFRNASISDIPFLIETILEAEKSGTDKLTYSTIFGLTEDETKEYLAKILAEEVDGCELSISSFLLAEFGTQVVAASAAWIECVNGMPSTIIKGNLLNYTLPNKALEKALSLNSIVSDLHIAYIPNSIQIGLVYVSKAFRGQNLASLLIEEQIKSLLKKNTGPTGIYLQVFGNNLTAIKTYDKANFKIVLTKESTHKDILDYMPSKSKVLMKREL